MSDEFNARFIGPSDIVAAQQRLGGALYRTPLIPAPDLRRLIGGSVALKAELLQLTGSFKPRAALNRLKTLKAAGRARGVITISADNHGARLAFAAALLGVKATTVMPEAAATIKVEEVPRHGGCEVLHGTSQDLLAKCRELQYAEDQILVHPFDDPLVLVPVAGGGLISGIATVLKATQPKTRIIEVEPEGAAAMTRSLAQGAVVNLERTDTIADGAAPPLLESTPWRRCNALSMRLSWCRMRRSRLPCASFWSSAALR